MAAQQGIVYIAYGEKARISAKHSLNSHNIPAELVGDQGSLEFSTPPDFNHLQQSRWAKVNLDLITPYQLTLYLDADVHFVGEDDKIIKYGFRMLRDGWDIVLCPSSRQSLDAMGHVGEEERLATISELMYTPLALQCGVFFFNKKTTALFFEAWRSEWKRFKDQDQAAFLRALNYVPLKIWLLGAPWNNKKPSGVFYHKFGTAR